MIGIVSELVVTVATYSLLVILSLKRGTFDQLPLRVKISSIVQAIYAPCFLAMLIYNIKHQPYWGIFICFRSSNTEVAIWAAVCHTIWICL